MLPAKLYFKVTEYAIDDYAIIIFKRTGSGHAWSVSVIYDDSPVYRDGQFLSELDARVAAESFVSAAQWEDRWRRNVAAAPSQYIFKLSDL